MIKLWTRNKTLILIIIILSLIGIYFISSIYVISPLKTEAKNVESEASVHTAQIKKLENHEESVEFDDLGEVILQMPDNKSPDDVLSTIQKVSKEAKVTVEGIRSTGSNEEISQEVEEVGSTFSIQDSYSLEISADKLANINAFLDQIIVTDRLLTIDTLLIEQSGSESTAEITFSVYHTNP